MKDALTEAGIASAVYYPVSIYLTPALLDFGYKSGLCRETEKASEEVLSLPLFATMTDDQAEAVCGCIVDFYG